jgi:glycosyltransferase involved in cell wall biosynthesis
MTSFYNAVLRRDVDAAPDDVMDVASRQGDVQPASRPAQTRAIILFFNGTFVHRRNGAHARVSALLRFLTGRGCRVILYSYADHPDCPWAEEEEARFARDYPGVELVLDRRPRALNLAIRAKRLLAGFWPGLAPRLIRSGVSGATPGLARLVEREPDAVYIVNYANGLFDLNGLPPSAPVIVETHDLDFVQFSKRFGHALTSLRIMGKFRAEMALLERAQALIAIAPTESGMFKTFFPAKPVFFIPDYGVDTPPPPGALGAEDIDLLFIGSENPFNVEGLRGFMVEQADFLKGRTMAVAGSVCRDPGLRAEAARHAGVSLLGFVDEIAPLFARSRLVVSPVDGTGLKIKVVEALAAGKPVFGSRHTLEGLPGSPYDCTFPIDAEAMADMLADEPRRRAAGEAARRYAERLEQEGETGELVTFLHTTGACPAEA